LGSPELCLDGRRRSSQQRRKLFARTLYQIHQTGQRSVSFVQQHTESRTRIDDGDIQLAIPVEVTLTEREYAIPKDNVSKLTWTMLVPHSTQLDTERIATSTPESEPGVRVVRRHHLLVRYSHWLNVSIFLGLILSGLLEETSVRFVRSFSR
jgi:hypothetical protein